jgi:thymidylate synthase
MERGKPQTTEDGEETIELQDGISIVIDTPLAEPRLSEKYDFGRKASEQYAKNIISGSEEHVFEYDYWTRLHKYVSGGTYMDQIKHIVDLLKHNETKVTRRAIAITWEPYADWVKKDVPCLQLILCTVRDERLHMKVVFRSNDFLSALGANMYGLVELQKKMADDIGVEIGTYTHIALIPHVYHKRDATQLEKMTSP